MNPTARLQFLLAQNAPQALILRRGPSRQTAVIGWHRKTDTFAVGQWLKGKIYAHRCDIAPDGKHWVYFAMGQKGQAYTAVAKPPYLKALDFYPQNDAWFGGGLFATNQSYWLASGEEVGGENRHNSGLTVLPQWEGQGAAQTENFIYFTRLAQNGWQQGQTSKNEDGGKTTLFTKPAGAGWLLQKSFKTGQPSAQGQGVYTESHLLRNTQTSEEFLLPNAEWAEMDGKRLVWAQQGQIMAAGINKNGLHSQKVLFDANPLTFTELQAPY